MKNKGMFINLGQDWIRQWHDNLSMISCCDVCEQPLTSTSPICDTCLDMLPRFKLDAVNGDLLNRPEIYQLFKPLHFHHLIAVSPYQYPIKQWLTNYKYRRQLRFQQLCAKLLSYQLVQLKNTPQYPPLDIVVPMPIHPSKWMQRGFNQCHGLAKAVSNVFERPINYYAVNRIKHAAGQVGKTGASRRKALSGHFEIANAATIANQHVWLVDDIVTTGSTANEVSQLLMRAGALSVTLVALAISL